MDITGNTVLITGGGSGLGRRLAEALLRRGNTVIIAGRSRASLDATVAANPGMHAVVLDISSSPSVDSVARQVIERFPGLNVLINNAGRMHADDPGTAMDVATAEDIVSTNFMGAVRMTSAVVDHLRAQPRAAIVNLGSGLGFTPIARAAIYSATKAAVHAYTLCLRHRLRETSVRVVEIVPPRVQLDPGQQVGDIPGMGVDEYTREVIERLAGDEDEIVIGEAAQLRNNAGPGELAMFTGMNLALAGATLE